jgi:hypothetical protein
VAGFLDPDGGPQEVGEPIAADRRTAFEHEVYEESELLLGLESDHSTTGVQQRGMTETAEGNWNAHGGLLIRVAATLAA